MSFIFVNTSRRLAPSIRLRAPDPSLVAFPNEQLASCVQVFRNAVSSDEESRIAEDLSVVMDKEGETAYAEATLHSRTIRNRATDLHGFEPNVKIRDWTKMTDRIVKGIVWSPTLAQFCKEVAPLALKYDAALVAEKKMTHEEQMLELTRQLEEKKAEEIRGEGEGSDAQLRSAKAYFSGATNDHPSKLKPAAVSLLQKPLGSAAAGGAEMSAADKAAEAMRKRYENVPRPKADNKGRAAPLPGELIIPDTAKIVEHQLPGYEMHVEQPIVGSTFLMLNLMSPTVITFDDESTNQMGEVMLPERSLMRVSGEVRWGWRLGERFDKVHIFSMTRRHVRPTQRYSLTLFRYAKHLVDQRKLQETVEAGVKKIADTDNAERERQEAEEQQQKKKAQGAGAIDGGEHDEWKKMSEEEKKKRRESEKAEEEAFASNVLKGQGMLGGDLPTASMAMGRAAQLGTSPQQTGATMSDKMKKYHGYAADLGKIGHFMQTVTHKQSEAGARQLGDSEIHEELRKMRASASVTDDGYQYDMDSAAQTWEQMAERSQHYKQKLQQMTYDALQDTASDDGDDNGAGNSGKLSSGDAAAVPESSKSKPMARDPKHFTGPGVVGTGTGSASSGGPVVASGPITTAAALAEKRKMEQMKETLRLTKEKGMTSEEVKNFGADLDVEPFDLRKAAENINKNWRGKLKPVPSTTPPPPPASMM